jgi:hypothetical protein
LHAFNGTEGFFFYFCLVGTWFIGLPIDGIDGSPRPPEIGGGINPPIDGRFPMKVEKVMTYQSLKEEVVN